MEEQKEAASNCSKPEPPIATQDDHQDQSVDHDRDQHIMKNKCSDELVHGDQDEYQDLPFVCPVCNERFKTGQTLDSHKKEHNLSPDNKIDEDSSNSAKPRTSDHLDLENSLKQQGKNWLVTAKRGSGKSTGLSSPAASKLLGTSGLDKTANDAAVELMILAHHKPDARAELMSILDRIRKDKRNKEKEEVDEAETEEENSGGWDIRSEEEQYKNENKIKKGREQMESVGGGDLSVSADERAAEDNNGDEDNDHVSAHKGGSAGKFSGPPTIVYKHASFPAPQPK